jgi:hypothetical protein
MKPFHETFLSLWDPGYHRAFSWNFSFTFGTSAITEPFRETFLSLLDLWLSRSLFMNFLSHFGTSANPFMEASLHSGISSITRPFHGIIHLI